MSKPEPILVVEDVSKTFTLHLLGGKRVAALAATSFVVPDGAFLAVIGRSGSGKSTLLKCLYRTYLPSTGQAWFRPNAPPATSPSPEYDRAPALEAPDNDNQSPVMAMNDEAGNSSACRCHGKPSAAARSDGHAERRERIGADENDSASIGDSADIDAPSQSTNPPSPSAWIDLAHASDETIVALRGPEIGYVSQFLRATPRVPATDLVAAPLIGRGVDRKEARARAAELLRRLDLPGDLLDGFPALFSGGEQQRVNLARALIALPRLLLLDEPTSALDAANQTTVVTLLEEARSAGTTIVAIFHDLALVRRLADGFLHFREGRLVASGSTLPVEMEAVA